ncbi:HNH endonuclease [Microbacterium phage Sharkboy]|uniref:HNH endonuclease n=2 Tax=Dismasvirus dismas TaxID=2560588 RepID=A0A516KUD2_9CAUD|nr:HNH endonuclease [Microbacterium phage Kieran]QDP45286.1 HNH endonuclease [Microbacterium phage Sharkboy]UYL86837.1 HNH endonuclease [Microbacterium phage Rona]
MTRSHAKSIARSAELTSLAGRRWGPKRRWRCVYCGRGAGMVVDHFVPEKRGGEDTVFNLVPACDRCNSSKQDHEPEAWMQAVGVPEARRAALWRILHLPSSASLTVPAERFELDYGAAKALRRPFQGAKGG